MEHRRETVAAGCVGAADNSQCYHRDNHSSIPDGTGFLNRAGDTLESAVLLSGVHKNGEDSLTLTTSRRRVV